MKHDIDWCTGNCLACGATRENLADSLADPLVCYGREAHERRMAAWDVVIQRRNGGLYPGTCSEAELLRCEDEIAGFVQFRKAVPAERVIAPFPAAAYRVLAS